MIKEDEQTKTHRHGQQYGGYQREVCWVKRVKYVVTEGDLTFNAKHTMQYADDVL